MSAVRALALAVTVQLVPAGTVALQAWLYKFGCTISAVPVYLRELGVPSSVFKGVLCSVSSADFLAWIRGASDQGIPRGRLNSRGRLNGLGAGGTSRTLRSADDKKCKLGSVVSGCLKSVVDCFLGYCFGAFREGNYCKRLQAYSEWNAPWIQILRGPRE